MGTSDIAEYIDRNVNSEECLVIDTTYNELNENIRSDTEEDATKENGAKSVSDMVQNRKMERSDREERSDLPTENATTTNKAQNPSDKDSETVVQIKIEEISDDKDVQYVQTIRKDVVQEIIDLDTLVDKDVTFVREDQQYIWIDYPLRGAARDYVNKILCKMNKGRMFYTDNDKQREYLMYILEYMKHYNFYLDYAIKNRGFSIFRNYTQKIHKWSNVKYKKINVKFEPWTSTDHAASVHTNEVTVKVERV